MLFNEAPSHRLLYFFLFLTLSFIDDLKSLCRLIDKDLKINVGAKFVLNGLHPEAFSAYNNNSNLKSVIDHVLKKKNTSSSPLLKKQLSLVAVSSNPIKPMLAKPVKSFDELFKKSGITWVAEIKYDGERVQVHYTNSEFKFYSRNLKPVKENKVDKLDHFFIQSIDTTHIHSFIMDGEVLAIDSVTKKMLPFGSLGVHNQKKYPNAQLCYFIFDLLYLNGQSIMDKSYGERRNTIYNLFKKINGRIEYSESYEILTRDDIDEPWNKVLSEGLEGLVIKDKSEIYKPNQRHWIKLKRDYLDGMGDTVDLIVLGGYWGKGTKGGKIATFLMGIYDEDEDVFKTVCKVYSGLTDADIENLQTAFDFDKIDGDSKKVPSWLRVTKSLVPNFIVKDPTNSQVWEIMGTSFSLSKVHTAKGISIRFPRVNKFRDDKTYKSATTLKEIYDMAIQQQDIQTQLKAMGEVEPGSNVKAVVKVTKESLKALGMSTTSSSSNTNSSSGSNTGSSKNNHSSDIKSREYKRDKGICYVSGSITDLIHQNEASRVCRVVSD